MPSAEQIINAAVWPKGLDLSHEKYLIETGALGFDRLGGKHSEYIFLSRAAVVDDYTGADRTSHWYRGMPKEEFDELFKFNIVGTKPNSYTGIAPYRGYVTEKFFRNTSRGTHVVEFGVTTNLAIDEDFSIYRNFHNRGFSLKAEGGGTFGLGDKGSVSAAQKRASDTHGRVDNLNPQQRDAMKTAADLFTEWLYSGKIYRKLVNLRLDAKGSAKQILGLG
jgi:hypothetical protein